MFDCSMISDDVRLSPMIRGDARSLRLPGRFGIRMVGVRAAQRWPSTAPLAGSIEGTTQQHRTRIKNAPVLRPRQRRQLQGVLGRGFGYPVCSVCPAV